MPPIPPRTSVLDPQRHVPSPEPADTPRQARDLARDLAAAAGAEGPGKVRTLYACFTRAGGTSDPELRCVATVAASTALSQLGSQREAFELILQAWRHTPPRGAATAMAMATLAAGIASRSALPEHLERLRRLLERAQDTTVHAPQHRVREDWSLAGFADPALTAPLDALVTAATDPAGAGHALHTPDPDPGPAASETPACTIVSAMAAHRADEPELRARSLERLEPLLASRQWVGLQAWILPTWVEALMDAGHWRRAQTLIDYGRNLAFDHRLAVLAADIEALAATLRALRGAGTPDALPLTASAWTGIAMEENRATHARTLRARALTATTAGDPSSAYRHLRALFADDGTPLDAFLSPRSIAHLAAAAREAGHAREAAAVLERVREAHGPRTTTRMTLLTHHAAALLGEAADADPDHHFWRALSEPRGEAWPWERAQARLHYADWLDRNGRPLDARAQRELAAATQTRLGCRLPIEPAFGETD